MSDEEYNALEFGKVLARLDSQDRILSEVHLDIEKIFLMLHEMQQQEVRRCNETKGVNASHDWGREIVIALLGALAYFILDHFISGGK